MTEDELILTHILGISRSELYLHKPQLTELQEKQFQSYKARRQKGEPLQYIFGDCDFMGLELKVDPRVLVPRPETEILVDLAIKKFHGAEILDIGTGSGNIAIALAKHFPKAHVITIDVSKDALDLAQENAKIHSVSSQIGFIHTSIFDYVPSKRFDFIISNPPYIPSGKILTLPIDVQQEPHLALDGGMDGLDFYRAIIKMIPGLIRPKGCLMMEFGDGQGLAVKDLVHALQTFSNIQIHKDLTGRDRIISAE